MCTSLIIVVMAGGDVLVRVQWPPGIAPGELVAPSSKGRVVVGLSELGARREKKKENR